MAAKTGEKKWLKRPKSKIIIYVNRKNYLIIFHCVSSGHKKKIPTNQHFRCLIANNMLEVTDFGRYLSYWEKYSITLLTEVLLFPLQHLRWLHLETGYQAVTTFGLLWHGSSCGLRLRAALVFYLNEFSVVYHTSYIST